MNSLLKTILLGVCLLSLSQQTYAGEDALPPTLEGDLGRLSAEVQSQNHANAMSDESEEKGKRDFHGGALQEVAKKALSKIPYWALGGREIKSQWKAIFEQIAHHGKAPFSDAERARLNAIRVIPDEINQHSSHEVLKDVEASRQKVIAFLETSLSTCVHCGSSGSGSLAPQAAHLGSQAMEIEKDLLPTTTDEIGKAPHFTFGELISDLSASGGEYEYDDNPNLKPWKIHGLDEFFATSRQIKYFENIQTEMISNPKFREQPIELVNSKPTVWSKENAPWLASSLPVEDPVKSGKAALLVHRYEAHFTSLRPPTEREEIREKNRISEAYQTLLKQEEELKRKLGSVQSDEDKTRIHRLIQVNQRDQASKQKELEHLDLTKPLVFYLVQEVSPTLAAQYQSSPSDEEALKRKIVGRSELPEAQRLKKVGHLTQAREILKRLAEWGIAEGQYEYAKMLGNGEGGEPNIPEAKRYAALAQSQGLPEQKFLTPEEQLERWTKGMIELKAGVFEMGSPSTGPDNEHTDPSYNFLYQREKQHKVKIPQSYLAANMTTQGEYEELMGVNPSGFKCEKCPVTNVSYKDIQEYFKRLNAQVSGLYKKLHPGAEDKQIPKFRLPSEELWEYATTEDLGLGAESDGKPKLDGAGLSAKHMKYSGTNRDEELKDYAVYSEDPNHPLTHVVEGGTKKHNPRGFYDLNGNALEWTSTVFKEDPTQTTHLTKLQDPPAGSDLVNRGGGFYDGKLPYLRASVRGWMPPSLAVGYLGFRREMYF